MTKELATRMDLTLRNSRIKLPLGQVFWREVGQGATLVFLHGSWQDGSQWLPVIEYLGQTYHCFVPDLLGFGDSENPKLHYSIQLEAECLLSYLEALNLSQVYLIGHSLGAWVATTYALNHSDRVQGMVLLAPEGMQLKKPGKAGVMGRPSLTYHLLRSLLPLARLFRVHKRIEQALKQRQPVFKSSLASQLLFQRRRAEIQAELLPEKLENLTVPTLIIQGEKDDSAVIDGAKIYVKTAPKAQLWLIEQGGHDLPESLPGLVAQQIDDFVKSQRSNWSKSI